MYLSMGIHGRNSCKKILTIMDNSYDSYVRFLRQSVHSFNEELPNKETIRAFIKTPAFQAGAKKIWENKGITGIEQDIDVQMMCTPLSWPVGMMLYAMQQLED